MRTSKQIVVVAAAAAAVATTAVSGILATPANAAGVLTSASVIDDYFKNRDLAWYGSSRVASANFSGLKVSSQAQHKIDDIAKIADEYRVESGNTIGRVATTTSSVLVSSTCAEHVVPALSGDSACKKMDEVYSTDVGTMLTWKSSGTPLKSFIGGTYTVKVQGEISATDSTMSKGFVVTEVTPAPLPMADATAPTVTDLGLRPASTDRKAGQAAQARIRSGRTAAINPGKGQVSAAATYVFDPNAAAKYAVKWAKSFNPDYSKQDNDCTNFVSQALQAGGWKINDGVDPDDKVNWSPNLTGPRGPSKTWSVAPWLMEYTVKTSKRGTALGRAEIDNDWNSLWTLLNGDIIFPDWGPNGTDGAVDHVMIVTGSITNGGSTEPTISQHTTARENLPISVSLKLAKEEWNKPMHYYPVRTNVNFEA